MDVVHGDNPVASTYRDALSRREVPLARIVQFHRLYRMLREYRIRPPLLRRLFTKLIWIARLHLNETAASISGGHFLEQRNIRIKRTQPARHLHLMWITTPHIECCNL